LAGSRGGQSFRSGEFFRARAGQHDREFMQMNVTPIRTSGWVQYVGLMVSDMTNGKGISRTVDLEQEDTMLKQISAALLAASLLTAPALAAESKSTSTTPATTAATVKASDNTAAKTSNKSVSAKPADAMNAKAQATTTPPTTATPAAKPAVKKVRHSMHHRRHHNTTVSSNVVKSQKVASIKHIQSSKSAIKVQPAKS
jgi:hypothetical protein